MGGFKSGAADADWDDNSTDEDENKDETAKYEGRDPEGESLESPSTEGRRSQFDSVEDNVERGEGRRSGNRSKSRYSSEDLPWVLARDGINDGREKTVQVHFQQSTLETQRECKSTIEKELGESVKKADLREAALLVGLQQTESVANILREWGYDIE